MKNFSEIKKIRDNATLGWMAQFEINELAEEKKSVLVEWLNTRSEAQLLLKSCCAENTAKKEKVFSLNVALPLGNDEPDDREIKDQASYKLLDAIRSHCIEICK